MNKPGDVANQALDAIGAEFQIGDLEDGTREANVLNRAYRQCLMQLLRAAHWDFARKQAPLTLLADASGQTQGVGNLVPVPWIYEYSYPTDCLKARFIPWNQAAQNPAVPPGNITPVNPASPVVSGLGQPPLTGQRIVPARFTIATDYNYPPLGGQLMWEVQGVSPEGRTVVLTNVQNANLVYTALMRYPSVWDPNFRAAFVAYLASEIVLPVLKDKKLGMTLRKEQIAIAREKIAQARITDGNEGWYNSDLRVNWMSFRNTGGYNTWWGGGWEGGGPGVLWYGWDGTNFADGSAY